MKTAKLAILNDIDCNNRFMKLLGILPTYYAKLLPGSYYTDMGEVIAYDWYRQNGIDAFHNVHISDTMIIEWSSHIIKLYHFDGKTHRFVSINKKRKRITWEYIPV